MFIASGFTWMFNRGYCRDCGVDLVSIETEEEWFFIDSKSLYCGVVHRVRKKGKKLDLGES